MKTLEDLPEETYNLVQKIIGFWSYDFITKLRNELDNLTLAEKEELYEIFDKVIHNDSFESRITIFDEIAKEIKCEIKIYEIGAAAIIHNKIPGNQFYCDRCRGNCQGEEAHDAQFKVTHKEPLEHLVFNKMSRNELLKIIKYQHEQLKNK